MEGLDPQAQEYWDKLPDFLQNPDPNIYRSNNYTYVDFETTNIDKGDPNNPENSIVLAVWIIGAAHPGSKGKPVLKVRWGNEFELEELVRDIEQSDYFSAHNAKFEYGWLKRCGLDTPNSLAWCTQVGEYVLAGNRKWGQMCSLEKALQSRKMGGKDSHVGKLMKNGVCPSEIPKNWLKKYGKIDALKGHDLMLRQRREIFKAGLHKTFFTHMLFTPVLDAIESVGMCLDKDRVTTIHKKFADELRGYARELDEITGGINTGSPKQMANFLYRDMKFAIPKDHRGKELLNKPSEDWPDGVPQTNADAIAKLKGRSKKQKRFLGIVAKHSKLKAAMSKSLDKFLDCVNETEDGILYANLNQTRTVTHRLSSTGKHYKAQFQNFDRRFKPLFKARNGGWLVGEADEGQLEYRVAVYLGQDRAGLYDITHGVDAHGFTASIIFKEEWEACGGDRKTPEGKRARTDSKAHTFKPLYGGHSGTPRQVAYYDAFREKHQGISNAQGQWISEVYRNKRLTMETGLTFYWDDARLNRNGKLIRPDGRPVDQSVCNTPVQYLATGEIVPVSVVYLFHLMRAANMESFLVNTVHDSAIAEINPTEKELFEKLSVLSMEDIIYWYLKTMYDIDFNVPLEAEVEVETNWADSQEWREEFLAA